MTCTIGFTDGCQVYIASDAATTDDSGSIVIRRGNPKVWNVRVPRGPEMLVGFSGNCSEGNFIRYVFRWPKMKTSNFMQYLVENVVPEIKKQIKRFFKDQSNISWNLLIAVQWDGPHLYVLYDNGDVEAPNDSFCAIGSASEYAIGALESMIRFRVSIDPWDMLEEALHICSIHHTSVRGPYTIQAL